MNNPWSAQNPHSQPKGTFTSKTTTNPDLFFFNLNRNTPSATKHLFNTVSGDDHFEFKSELQPEVLELKSTVTGLAFSRGGASHIWDEEN